jgi:hypothetical protein
MSSCVSGDFQTYLSFKYGNMNYVNDTFEEFARCLMGEHETGEPLPHAAILNRTTLDYSLESLRTLDAYLLNLFENRPERMRRDWVNIVLWGGAYVGEVIRRNANRVYDWVDFDDWLNEYPEQMRILGRVKALEVCALLTPGAGAFTLPLNKVYKFIANGPEDSVWFYVACELKSGT